MTKKEIHQEKNAFYRIFITVYRCFLRQIIDLQLFR